MAKFGIRRLQYNSAKLTGKDKIPYDQWIVEEIYLYDTFEEAKEQAKILTDSSRPYKYETYFDSYYGTNERRCTYQHDLEQDPTWQYMAFKLAADADYEARVEKLKAEGVEFLPEHMTSRGSGYQDYLWEHPRLDREAKRIGYYETKSAAIHDRISWVKPTRYFARWFTENQMWDFMAELGLATADMSLTFVNTREDIRYVYENGPESCMSGRAANYCGIVHPTEAYASPDLELAVLHYGDLRQADNDDGEGFDHIRARALCNKHTKEYVRIYGDTQRMKKALEEAGYKKNEYCLGGCRLLKLFVQRSEDDIDRQHIMTPYLDGCCNEMEYSSDAEYLTIIKRPQVVVGSTCGYAAIM
jgi:hypothetical protein